MFYKKLLFKLKISERIWYLEQLKLHRENLQDPALLAVNRQDIEQATKEINDLLNQYKYL